jgi:large subunit ribosomal protein L25
VIDLGDGKSFTAILKDIQVHPVTDDILHIDSFKSLVIKKSLLKFLLKSLVTKGVMAGGDLRLNNRKLKVKAYQNLPDFVEADITPLNKLYVTQVLHQTSKSCTQTTQ